MKKRLIPDYRGRFAPSPTGPLHFCSLVAATGSYADALAHGGEWLMRMEDVDETRRVEGAADAILHTLEIHGFQWNGDVVHQSQRKERYREVIDHLLQEGYAYHCSCTRREVRANGRPGIEGVIYAGTCRGGLPPGREARAIRLQVPDREICFKDRVHGTQCQQLARDVGDFIIRRADGFTAYQLAVVVDDADQGINQVVRGADLLHSTPRQIHLQKLLNLTCPAYAHLPLVLDQAGRKLSKSEQAHPVSDRDPLSGLFAAWRFLGQEEPEEIPSSVEAFWQWATTHWDITRISPFSAP